MGVFFLVSADGSLDRWIAEAKGFSTISFSWGLGGLIAPTLGGFLSEPVLKYPGLEL